MTPSDPSPPSRPYRGPDRRQRPTPVLSRYSFFGGRRRAGRRDGEVRDTFVDLYSLRSWVALSVFLLLNLLDSHFTLIYLQRGGEEGNPVAIQLMEGGMVTFILVKALGIGAAAVLFCLLKNFRNGRVGVLVALALYQLLLFYHLSLYFNWYDGSVLP